MIFDAETQTTTPVLHRNYDSFGNLVSELAPAVDEIFGFTGRMFDEATGLQNNLNRWYDPKVGKWISEDPIGILGGDSNFARYVGNSPTNYTDPDGEARKGIINGITVIFEKETAEFLLENGRRIKVRNAKFIGSEVSVADLRRLTGVCDKTLDSVQKKFPGVKIKFDELGQPDFSKYKEAVVKLSELGGSNPWNALKSKDRRLYDKLIKRQHDLHWHHSDDTLQLVDKDLHNAYQHTGPRAIMSSLASAGIVMLVPGAQAFKEGRICDGVRDTGWGWLPLTWISDTITSVSNAFYSWAEGDLFGSDYQQEMDEYRKQYWK